MIIMPHGSHLNIQLGSLYTSDQQAAPTLQPGGGALAEWLFVSVNCWGVQLCRAVTLLSCFPIRRTLRNLPASYEHEVNKTLGHHKSRANDMSGAEIRLHQSGAVECRAWKPLMSHVLQPCSSCSPPRSQCVRSLLKLELN